jgi:hypothetical protein
LAAVSSASSSGSIGKVDVPDRALWEGGHVKAACRAPGPWTDSELRSRRRVLGPQPVPDVLPREGSPREANSRPQGGHRSPRAVRGVVATTGSTAKRERPPNDPNLPGSQPKVTAASSRRKTIRTERQPFSTRLPLKTDSVTFP